MRGRERSTGFGGVVVIFDICAFEWLCVYVSTTMSACQWILLFVWWIVCSRMCARGINRRGITRVVRIRAVR